MKTLSLFLLLLGYSVLAQKISGVQLFNPKTNDETPVIGFNDKLILRFDDFSNKSEVYRYTIKHYNRNWEDDNLFFTEYATGSLNGILDRFEYSFNTLQPYTHYSLTFPNEKMQPKISGNFELIVFKDSQDKPLLKKRFFVVEDGAQLGLNITRYSDAKKPNINQRVEVQAAAVNQSLLSNVSSVSLNVMQNNNPNLVVYNQKPTTTMGNKLMFQQMSLTFPGNNEFYYFDNKNMNLAADMVAATETKEGVNYTYLHPVWAYPLNYQYQPDVNGAYYFRRNDLGTERNADNEGDYSWVQFSLESDPMENDLYILGVFNNYQPSDEYKMIYDDKLKMYLAKIYLKQGFYNYLIASKASNGVINYGEVNGNFWQTDNLYQAFLYYAPFGRNYDGLIGYGEFRSPVR